MPEEENQAQFGFMSQVDFLMFMGARVEKRSHVLKLIVNNSFGPRARKTLAHWVFITHFSYIAENY